MIILPLPLALSLKETPWPAITLYKASLSHQPDKAVKCLLSPLLFSMPQRKVGFEERPPPFSISKNPMSSSTVRTDVHSATKNFPSQTFRDKKRNPELDYDICQEYILIQCSLNCLHTSTPLSCVMVNFVFSRMGAYVGCVVLPNWFYSCQTFLSAVHSATYGGRKIAVISFASIGNSAFGEFNTCHKGNNWKRNDSKPASKCKKKQRCNIPNNGLKLPCLFAIYLLLLTR